MSTEALKVDPHSTLWVTDAELIRRGGIPEDIARETIRALDANPRSGFPRKIKMWGDRRYWPAVVLFFERSGGLHQVPQVPGYPQEQRRSA